MTKQVEYIVGYGRVSSAEQADSHLSLDMQKEHMEKYAKAKGCEFVYFEDPGKTGSNTNRKGLSACINFVKHNKVKCVVVWKLDRLSRCQEDFFAEILKPIKKYGSTIASIQENFDDIRRIKKVLIGVFIGQAEDELDNIKERTSSVIQNRVSKGYKHGKAPIGYLNARDEFKHGIIVPDPNKAHYIKQCFDLYATGIFSMERLGQELAKYGFRDSKGKPHPKKRIDDILKDVTYMGKVMYNGEIIDGQHDAIISEDLFYRVQLMLSGTNKTRTHNEYFTYSNFITCAKCGYKYVAMLKHGAHNSGNYIYYHCNNYTKIHKKQKNIRQDYIDEAMQEVIDSFEISEKDIKRIKSQINDAISDLRTYEKKSVKELEKQYENIVDEIGINLSKNNTASLGVSENTRKEIIKKLEKKKDEIANKISNINETSKDSVKRISILIDFANRLPELYLKATLEEKRLILATITDKITFNEDTNTLSVQLKPIFEHLRQIKMQEKKTFSENLFTLHRTLETRSEQAKETLRNDVKNISTSCLTRTQLNLINTEIESSYDNSKKLNVVGGT